MSQPATSDSTGSVVADREVAHLQSILRMRRRCREIFRSTLFACPAWDMLLELALARMLNKPMSTKAIVIGSGTPAATARRWLDALEADGSIMRVSSPSDNRVTYVRISDSAFASMRLFIAELPFFATNSA